VQRFIVVVEKNSAKNNNVVATADSNKNKFPCPYFCAKLKPEAHRIILDFILLTSSQHRLLTTAR